ncbi:hypothetical protein ACJX0J_036910, partial [Zea mays]
SMFNEEVEFGAHSVLYLEDNYVWGYKPVWSICGQSSVASLNTLGDGLGATQNWETLKMGGAIPKLAKNGLKESKFYKWPKGGLIIFKSEFVFLFKFGSFWLATVKNLHKKELLKLECFSVFGHSFLCVLVARRCF